MDQHGSPVPAVELRRLHSEHDKTLEREIQSYYADLVNAGSSFQAMQKLTAEIQSSRYKDGLFAWTSAHDFCIVQTPVTYPYDGPFLRISPLADGQLEFRYIDTHVKQKRWHRVVDGDEGFARLERFIEQLHWFEPVN